MAETKKGAEEKAAALEESDQLRKKMARDIESLQNQIEELQAQNSKLDKSRRRLQDEVSCDAVCSGTVTDKNKNIASVSVIQSRRDTV